MRNSDSVRTKNGGFRSVMSRAGRQLAAAAGYIPGAVLLAMLIYGLVMGWFFPEEEDLMLAVRFAGMILMFGFAVIAALLRKTLFSKISGWLLFALTSPAVFLLIETYTHNIFTGSPVMKPKIIVLNILIYFCVLVFVALASTHTAAAVMTVSLVTGVFGFCNYLSVNYRSVPIYPWDILSVGTAVSVLDNYTIPMTGNVYFVIYTFVFIFSVAPLLNCRVRFKKWWINLIAAAVALAGTVGYLFYLRSDSAQKKYGYYTILFSEAYLYRYNGVALTLTWTSKFLSVEKPAGYDPGIARDLYSEYSESEPYDPPDVLPNVFVIMNEALSDPLCLGLDFTVSEDYFPFIHSLGSDDAPGSSKTGYVYISVKGGNTPNSEYEFLTGMSLAFLPAGSIPYQQYVSDSAPTLVSQMESMGYTSTALHPYYSSGWQRSRVYPLFGFDNIYFINDMTHRQRIRTYISDRAMYDELIGRYNADDTGKPFFFYGVTMQNHSSYTQEYDGLRQIKVEGVNSVALEQYLTLMKRSDDAFKYLVEYIENNISEPTVVLMYGDHQPLDSVYSPIYRLNGKYAELASTDPNVQQKRYMTPYVIWTNYDVDLSSVPDELSCSYLAGALLDAIGLELTPFQKYQKTVMEKYPVIYGGGFYDATDGQFHYIDDLDVPDINGDRRELLKKYEAAQYNYIFDRRHRASGLFELGKDAA